jgi:CHAD domain-containing protein
MEIEGTTPLWIAARILLYERGDDFFRRRDKVLKTFDAEDIHDLRVSSRRLREGLALFAPCYPPLNIAHLLRKFKLVTRLMGEIRNADEGFFFFTALADELGDSCRDDLAKLVSSFQKNRGKGLKKLKLGLRKTAPESLRDFYLRVINSPSLFNPSTESVDLFASLEDFASGALDSRFADVMKLVKDACLPEDVNAQHLLRIAVKRFRYRLEILAMLIGPRFAELHAAIKGYQEVLGKMHDLDVFAGIVRDGKFSPPVEQSVLDAMASKRAKLFGEFSTMLETTPFEAIGQQVRNGL